MRSSNESKDTVISQNVTKLTTEKFIPSAFFTFYYFYLILLIGFFWTVNDVNGVCSTLKCF